MMSRLPGGALMSLELILIVILSLLGGLFFGSASTPTERIGKRSCGAGCSDIAPVT
jgi:hypothetical protein